MPGPGGMQLDDEAVSVPADRPERLGSLICLSFCSVSP